MCHRHPIIPCKDFPSQNDPLCLHFLVNPTIIPRTTTFTCTETNNNFGEAHMSIKRWRIAWLTNVTRKQSTDYVSLNYPSQYSLIIWSLVENEWRKTNLEWFQPTSGIIFGCGLANDDEYITPPTNSETRNLWPTMLNKRIYNKIYYFVYSSEYSKTRDGV